MYEILEAADTWNTIAMLARRPVQQAKNVRTPSRDMGVPMVEP